MSAADATCVLHELCRWESCNLTTSLKTFQVGYADAKVLVDAKAGSRCQRQLTAELFASADSHRLADANHILHREDGCEISFLADAISEVSCSDIEIHV